MLFHTHSTCITTEHLHALSDLRSSRIQYPRFPPVLAGLLFDFATEKSHRDFRASPWRSPSHAVYFRALLGRSPRGPSDPCGRNLRDRASLAREFSRNSDPGVLNTKNNESRPAMRLGTSSLIIVSTVSFATRLKELLSDCDTLVTEDDGVGHTCYLSTKIWSSNGSKSVDRRGV